MSKPLRNFLIAVAALLIPGSALLGIAYWILWSPVVPPEPESRIVKVPSGSSFEAIVDSLLEAGVIQDRRRFSWAARLEAKRTRLKSGMFRIPARASNTKILDILASGRVATQRVTIPEGSTARYIAGLLQRTIEVDSAAFMSLVHDSSFARSLGVDAPSLEGYLFPDTYRLTWGLRPEQMIRILVGQFQKVFDDSLRQRAAEIGMTVHETVTLASIIEGEVMVDDERPLVSAVYHNRLRAGWLLQADPTIQYLITDGPRRLLLRDLEIDSPYNTYKYPGLPPGPVNNPGRKSLEAALYPADVNYLYFVANGDGTHTFTRTMREHLSAKRKLDRLRRELRRKQRKGENGG
jgi:UPF0755 protein